MLYLENVGSATAFDLSAPIEMEIDTGTLARPAFLDVDGDGDQDVMSGDGAGGIRFFRNGSPPTAVESIDANAESLIENVFPNPSDGRLLGISLRNSVVGAVTIRLFDLQGRRLIERRVFPGADGVELSLDSRLSAGVYILAVRVQDHYDRQLVVVR